MLNGRSYRGLKLSVAQIRGAPAIASLAALGIASDLLDRLAGVSPAPLPSTSSPNTPDPLTSSDALSAHVGALAAYLITSRPTAVNLREALDRIVASASPDAASSSAPRDHAQQVVAACKQVWSEDVARNHSIGQHGAEWLLSRLAPSSPSKKISLLTVCNTGSLATSGYGTAFGVIHSLYSLGRLSKVYYMATAPYMQGARLTSLELQTLGIPAEMVPDTAAAWLIRSGAVDAFVCGADRVAANGDTANKISTYQISLLCKHAKPAQKQEIPVLVAAPLATLDLKMDDGSAIVIEQRPGWEACVVRGKIWSPPSSSSKPPVPAVLGTDGDEGEASNHEVGATSGAGKDPVVAVLVTPENTAAVNPAFDVTPAELIYGVVTEVGVADDADRTLANGGIDLRTFVRRAKGETIGDHVQVTNGTAHSEGGRSGIKNPDGTVNLDVLGQMQQGVAAKYRQTAANYRQNTGHDLSNAPTATAGADAANGSAEADVLRLRGGGFRLPIKNADGTVNLEGLAREREYVEAKYASAAEAYRKNTGQGIEEGKEASESTKASGEGETKHTQDKAQAPASSESA